MIGRSVCWIWIPSSYGVYGKYMGKYFTTVEICDTLFCFCSRFTIFIRKDLVSFYFSTCYTYMLRVWGEMFETEILWHYDFMRTYTFCWFSASRWFAQAFGCLIRGKFVGNDVWEVASATWETSSEGNLCIIGIWGKSYSLLFDE